MAAKKKTKSPKVGKAIKRRAALSGASHMKRGMRKAAKLLKGKKK